MQKLRHDCGTVLPLLGLAKGRRGTFAGVAACVGMLALVPWSGAGSPSLSGLRADDAGLAAKSRSVVLELYSLDARLTSAKGRLADLRAATTELRAERASLRHQVRLARLDTQLSQQRLAARLRFLYEYGHTSSIDLVMGARTLEDAMTQLDDYDRVTAANADVLVQVLRARRELTRLAGALAGRERALAASTASASHTVSELQSLTGARTAYLASLEQRRSLDAAQISAITARAAAADARAQALARVAVPAPPASVSAPLTVPIPIPLAAPRTSLAAAPVSAPPVAAAPVTTAPLTVTTANGRSLTVVATGYDLPGRTSTGLPVGWGIAAVDPSVIPLGTRIVIPGYGVAIAADTGQSIVGATIDLWFPTAQQAYAWGRRTVTIGVN